MSEEIKTCCTSCGARLTGRWESLTRGIVRTFIIAWQSVVDRNENSIHLKDLNLSVNQHNNWQKLRYFGLVAQVKDKPGHWLITRRGGQFIHGRAQVNHKLYIFRNHIQERSEDMVGILDVLKETDRYWPERFDFFEEAAPEPVQERLF